MRRISSLLFLPLFLAACGENAPDVTAPVVTLDLERFAVLRGGLEIPLTVEEENLAEVRLLADDTVIAVGGDWCHPSMPPQCPPKDSVYLITEKLEDGLYRFTVVAVDKAGNEGRSAEVPVIIANRGEKVELDYDPAPEVAIPEDYAGKELDVRATVASRAGIRKVITWVTWDASAGWLLEYSLGQGLCPHRGIQYTALESRDGELVIELDRADVDPAIVAKFPAADRESDTFPTNDDPLTFGLFFGHVKPMEPAEHAGSSLPIEAGLVYLYAEE